MMLQFWRLDPPFRYAVYGAFAVLFTSGAGWFIADQLKDSSSGELWQQASAYLLMVHGGTAMVTLMLLGALFPLHIGRAWRTKKNRTTGSIMVICNAVLIVSASGLYYLASEELRPWASSIHLAFGLAMPLLLLAHIKTGRNPSTHHAPHNGPGSQAPPRS